MIRKRVYWALCLALLHAGCQVGREIVDQVSMGDVPSLCPPAPPCELTEEQAEPGVEPGPSTARICEDPESCPSVAWEDLPSEGASIANARLSLVADTPREVSLLNARLQNVLIELAGPVTLRMSAQTQLNRVRFALVEGAGEPSLKLEDVDVVVSEIRSPAETAVGSALVERATLSQVAWSVRRLEVVSAVVDGGRLEAEQLNMADVQVARTQLGFERALVSAADFDDVNTLRCGWLTFAQGSITGSLSALGPCTNLLRLYGAEVREGDLDGPLQADGTSIVDTRLGAHGTTSVNPWSSEFRNVSFCRGAAEARIGQQTRLNCAECPEAPDFDPCLAREGAFTSQDNVCPLLAKDLAMCPQPWPVREHP